MFSFPPGGSGGGKRAVRCALGLELWSHRRRAVNDSSCIQCLGLCGGFQSFYFLVVVPVRHPPNFYKKIQFNQSTFFNSNLQFRACAWKEYISTSKFLLNCFLETGIFWLHRVYDWTVRRVLPHPLTFGHGCAAPVLNEDNILLGRHTRLNVAHASKSISFFKICKALIILGSASQF